MTIAATLTRGVVTASLLLLVAGPASAATPGPTTRGTAVTSSVPLHVEALRVPVDLGRTTLTATTDEDVVAGAPWSTVALTLADVAGETFGDVAVTSDGTTSSEGASIAETTAVGAVTAETASVFAIADDVAGSATAALATLTTEATVLGTLDLSVTITDVVASVDDTGAAATHSLAVAGIDLDLAHVLGSVLATLPLADLLAIADELGVELPVGLDPTATGDVAAATAELLTKVTAAVDAADGVDAAAQGLLDADDGILAALQGLLDTAEAVDLTDPAAVAAALAALVADPNLPTSCSSAATLAALVACLDTAVADHLLTLADELLALEGAVETYLGDVQAAVDASTVLSGEGRSLSDTVDAIATLLDDLLDADLVGLGPVEVSQQVRAVGGQLDASSASHTCAVTSLTVLGAAPVEIVDCDGGDTALTAAVATINATLGAVLDVVGGVDAGDGVGLEVFGVAEDAVTEDADGTVTATSVLEVLSLTVPEITVAPCDVATLGQLVCALDLDLLDTLDSALGTVTGALATAQLTASGALAEVEGILAALGSPLDVDAAEGAQATVSGAIAAVIALVEGLDLGSLGTGGVTVPPVTIVVDPALAAEHQVVAAGTPGAPAPAPAPAGPGGPTLPNTGGGAALLAVLALGAGAWLWRRRED